MKRVCRNLVIFLVSCWSTVLLALPITVADDVDPLVASGRISPSNPASEHAWVTSIIGDELMAGSRIDGEVAWTLIEGTSAYVLHTDSSAKYFLIKTGAGHPLGHTHFLYRNEGDPAYAVIDLARLGFDPAKIDASKVGYYAEFRAASVPEPGSLALLGGGLLGLAFVVKKRWAQG